MSLWIRSLLENIFAGEYQVIVTQTIIIHLNDETVKVFLNPISEMDDVDEELKNFLLYIAKGKPVDEFTRELEREVEEARKNKGWEEGCMIGGDEK